VPYAWPKVKPYVFGANEAPEDTTARLDRRLIPAWITDPTIRDLYRYAVTQAQHRKLKDLEEAISIANLVIGTIHRNRSQGLGKEIGILAEKPTFWPLKKKYSRQKKAKAFLTAGPGDEKLYIANFIDAWSKRKANRPLRGPDYVAGLVLNGLTPRFDSASERREFERLVQQGRIAGQPRRTRFPSPEIVFSLLYEERCTVEQALEAMGGTQKEFAEYLESNRHVLHRDKDRKIRPPIYRDDGRLWQVPGWKPTWERWVDRTNYIWWAGHQIPRKVLIKLLKSGRKFFLIFGPPPLDYPL
jgi:hypothetical protein